MKFRTNYDSAISWPPSNDEWLVQEWDKNSARGGKIRKDDSNNVGDRNRSCAAKELFQKKYVLQELSEPWASLHKKRKHTTFLSPTNVVLPTEGILQAFF